MCEMLLPCESHQVSFRFYNLVPMQALWMQLSEGAGKRAWRSFMGTQFLFWLAWVV